MTGKSRTETTTQTESAQPFEGTQDQLQEILELTGTSFQPGTTVAPLTEFQRQGISGLAGAAQQAGEVAAPAIGFGQNLLGATPTGIGTVEDIAGGGLVTSNPALLEALRAQRADIESSVLGRFEAAGRSGPNQAVARTLADRLAQAELPVVAQDISTQQARQLQAAQGLVGSGLQTVGLTPTLQGATAFAPELQLRAGGIQQAQRQAELDEPRRLLAERLGIVLPVATGFQTRTGVTEKEIPQPSTAQQLAGLGLTAASIGSRFIDPSGTLGAGISLGGRAALGGGGGGGFTPQAASFNPLDPLAFG